MAFAGPPRGGTRGGKADFSWEEVKEDKDRENYLGHSILAPKGRWQNGRDVTWYTKDNQAAADEDAAEIRKIKEAEEDALAAALGFTPITRSATSDETLQARPYATSEIDAEANQHGKDARQREKDARKADRARRREEKERRRRHGLETTSGYPTRRPDSGRNLDRDYHQKRPSADNQIYGDHSRRTDHTRDRSQRRSRSRSPRRPS